MITWTDVNNFIYYHNQWLPVHNLYINSKTARSDHGAELCTFNTVITPAVARQNVSIMVTVQTSSFALNADRPLAYPGC